MADHVDVWVRDRTHHPLRHGRGFLPQLHVRRGDDDVENLKHRVRQVQRPVFEDVDLDAL